MIQIINRANDQFTDGKLTYDIPADSGVVTIRPKGGYVRLLAGAGSSVGWTIDENEKFEIRTRDISNKQLVIEKEPEKTVNLEILIYTGVLS